MSTFENIKRLFFILLIIHFSQPLIKNIYHQYSGYFIPRTKVGLLTIKGQLSDSSYYIRHLNKFFKNDEIKALLIKMDCPGGAAGAGQATHDELRALKKEHPHKTVVVLVENTCASGGYYIASAADYIVAPGTALVGSIGVALPYVFQLSRFIEEYKVGYVPMTAGHYKATGDPFIDMTPEEKAQLQTVLDDSYNQFVDDIALNRSLSVAQAATWAEGKIFSARQAQKLGLIDELGSAHTAEKVLKEKGLIEGEIEWVRPPKKSPLPSWLGSGDLGDDEDPTVMTALCNTLCSVIETRYSKQLQLH